MRYDILTAREAALLLELEFQRHAIAQSGWDALNDAQQGRRGTSTLPVAKKHGKRYYRLEDVQEIARQIVGRGCKPPRPRPKRSELVFTTGHPASDAFVVLE